MIRKLFVLALFAALMNLTSGCSMLGLGGGGLPGLTSTIDLPAVGGMAAGKAPYANQVNYFGYVAPGKTPDGMETVNGAQKGCYFLYVWVPLVIDEIGIRMISPVGDLAAPADGDFVQPDFKLDAADATWFDCWVRFDKMSAVTADMIGDNMTVLMNLGEDDDGDDTYTEERHSAYNSLLRIADPTNLTMGCYRIAFTTYKNSPVEGSFVATVGTNIPGVQIATTPTALAALVNGTAAPAAN
ncbi:MAG: LipL32 family surface lipoprotein [Planctomycetes bacterium]|nr:LipL32 family surface lipoprotein [Planctomycetota bacterium]